MHKHIELKLELYKYMLASRNSDLIESELVNSGEANFLASSKGHEGSVILAPFLIDADWLHCHYRDKALMLARGITNEMFFYSALAKAESHSHGRQMVSHMSSSKHHIMSIVGPVGNNALQASGVAHAIKDEKDRPIVICSMGDGTSQQGEVLEAIAEAKRNNLPVLFFIHNNNLAISTRTFEKTFFSLPGGIAASNFYDIPITYLNGSHPLSQLAKVEAIIKGMRNDRHPQIIVFNLERLDNHSNADDQKLYRSVTEINQGMLLDPLIVSRDYLIVEGFSSQTLITAEEDTNKLLREAIKKARLGSEPIACTEAEAPLPSNLQANAKEYRGNFNIDSNININNNNNNTNNININVNTNDNISINADTNINTNASRSTIAANKSDKRLTMLEAMRQVFYEQLANNDKVCLLGQDIEDGKGDVFGITRGLSTAFPNRVKNSALSESTILGLTIGMALTGKKPVAFIQFADFMPLAFNQICTELATMYWRTNGSWQCPVIIFAACGGYRPGLGPFHSQTNEAIYVHIPGLDVYMPSNATDAAGLLNAAFSSGRPSLFLYPKKLLNNSSLEDTTSIDTRDQLVPIGKARIVRFGSDITLVGWGNTISLCLQVAETLETIGIEAEIIDLRTLKPYDTTTIINSVAKTKHLIVTHEDNLTCGLGSEIVAMVAENLPHLEVKVKRVARPDTYTPCNYANQLAVLPSYEKILTAAADILGLALSWQEAETNLDTTLYKVEVIGASPSDESVLITKLHVNLGDMVNPGDTLVDIEASKASGEILSPCEGQVEEIQVKEDMRALVGSPLLTIRLAQGQASLTQKPPRKAILKRKALLNKALNLAANITTDALKTTVATANGSTKPSLASTSSSALTEPSTFNPIFAAGSNLVSNSALALEMGTGVGMCSPHFKTGSRYVTNDELLQHFPGYSSVDIVKRTGIEGRYWLAEGENIVDLASEVAINALKAANLTLTNINAIICATSSPQLYHSPATACLVLANLYHTYGEHAMLAYDINAACSGYLYALQNAKDYLQTRPNDRVLVITAEYLSKRLNPKDFETAFLFADGVSATIVSGSNLITESKAILEEVYTSAIADNGDALNIPLTETQGITVQGRKVFTLAIKNMPRVLYKCCEQAGIELNSLDLIVPHQANQRILAAIESQLGLKAGTLYSNIAHYGNTSSCTIPIALAETMPKLSPTQQVALCAFGGGFTAGAALLKIIS